jgi:hypothetical protein
MWIDAVIMPREDARPWRPSPQRDRRAIYQAGCNESLRFREAVLGFLRSHELMGAVKWVSDPGSLPLVTLRCTERVLERLRKVPEFEAGRSLSLELRS